MSISHAPEFIVTSGVGLLGKSFKCKGEQYASSYIEKNFSNSPHPIRITIEYHKNKMEFICMVNENKIAIYIDSLGRRFALGEENIKDAVESMTHLTTVFGKKSPEELSEYIKNTQSARKIQEAKEKFNSIKSKERDGSKYHNNKGCLPAILIWGSIAAIWGVANVVAKNDKALANKFAFYGLIIWILSVFIALISGRNLKETKDNAVGFIYLVGVIIIGIFTLGIISIILPSSCTNSYDLAPADIHFRK